MTEQKYKRTPRMKADTLQELLDRIEHWFRHGDLSSTGWFQAEHPYASATWIVKIDVEYPLGQARWGHSEVMPVDPEALAALVPQHETWGPDDDEPLSVSLLRLELEDAVAELPAEERQCLELVVFGGLTVREAAEMLGVSHPTVWRRVRAAKKALAERLQ